MEIFVRFRPWLVLESEVLIEECMYRFDRRKGDSMQMYLTERTQKRADMIAALGDQKLSCPHCDQTFSQPTDLPEIIWSYMLKKGAHLTDEQNKTITNWDIDRKELVGDKLLEVLVKLERNDHSITAAGIAHARQQLQGGQYPA